MNIPLPESLKQFVDEQVAGRGFGTQGSGRPATNGTG